MASCFPSLFQHSWFFLSCFMASTSAVTLDDLASSAPIILDNPLFYPTPDDKDLVRERSKSPVEQQSRQVLKDRLYIGNLHPTVDEYAVLLLQIQQPNSDMR